MKVLLLKNNSVINSIIVDNLEIFKLSCPDLFALYDSAIEVSGEPGSGDIGWTYIDGNFIPPPPPAAPPDPEVPKVITRQDNISLIGNIDGTNLQFNIPQGIFLFDEDHKILIYKNGIRLKYLRDFTISESNGEGTGYNTIIMSKAPDIDDDLAADYYCLI